MVSRHGVSLDWGGGIVGLTLVLDIGNIARVGISNIVGDNLGAAIRKGNTVLSIGGVTIPLLILTKVGARVLISNTVLISINSRAIISRLLVAVDWCRWVVWGWSRLVSWGRMDNWLVHNWGWAVHWSWSMVWCWPVDNGSRVDDRLVNNWSWVVDWGRMVRSWPVDWDMSWSMNSSAVLLSSIWVVHVLGSSMGLLGNHGSIGAMGLVDRVAHSRGISVLDDLVVGLVSGSSGQEGRSSDKSL